MIEKYYTPEQLDELKARAEAVGPDRMRAVPGEWEALFAAVRAAMDAGTDPADPHVQALATKWIDLVNEFTGGNPGIAASVKKMWDTEPTVAGIDVGPVRAMQAYIQRALDARTTP
jgi:hypothetical protein